MFPSDRYEKTWPRAGSKGGAFAPFRCVVSSQEAGAADLRAESEVTVVCDIVSPWGAGSGLESQG